MWVVLTVLAAMLAVWMIRIVAAEQRNAVLYDREDKARALYELAKFVVENRGSADGDVRRFTDNVVQIELASSGAPEEPSTRDSLRVFANGRTVLSGHEWYCDIWNEGSCANGWKPAVRTAFKGPWTGHLSRLRRQIERDDRRTNKEHEQRWHAQRLRDLDL